MFEPKFIANPFHRRFTPSILLFLLPFNGCLPEASFPDEPLLEFRSFDPQVNGSRELIIGFSDGDGNMGLAQADTIPPFCSTCEYHQNLKCEYQEFQDGEWIEIELNPDAGQIPFYYRVPPAAPTGQNPSQNGTIAIDMNSWYLNSEYDSIRFRITLYDRDLNASNDVFTYAVAKP